MPDPGSSPGQALIRHSEVIEFTGFSDKSESSTGCGLSRGTIRGLNEKKWCFLAFCETINTPLSGQIPIDQGK